MNHELIKELLSGLLTQLDLPFEDIVVSDDEDITRVDIVSNQASKIIGWHGETLNSLQHAVKAMVRGKEKLSRSPFIVLDIDGYRRNQEERVCVMAEKKADYARRTGNKVALPPMSPYFRRIVHLHVAGSDKMKDITTESTGEGDNRQIVLRLKDGVQATAKSSDEGELAPVFDDMDGLDNLDV